MKRLGLLLSVLTFAVLASFFGVTMALADAGQLTEVERSTPRLPNKPLYQAEVGGQVPAPTTEGYRFARASAASVQKGQMALPNRGGTTITHSTAQTITAGNSISCNATGLHAENSYYRIFDLAGDFGITEAFDITEVQFGVEQATGAGGTQPVEVRLYTLSGPFVLANLTPIGSAPLSVPNQNLTIFSAPIAATVPAGALLVVEIFTPDGQAAGHSFFVGSNTAGQTDPSYIRAPSCGLTEPGNLATIGFPNMHIVINVTGDVAGGQPSITLDQTVGTDPSVCAVTDVITVTAGDTAYYCYNVTNTGAITLGMHDLDDSEWGIILDDFSFTLVPGGNAFITTSAPITVTTTNIGTWTAFNVGAETATATDTTTVNVTVPTAVQMSELGATGNTGFPLPLLAAGAGFLALAGLLVRRTRR